MKLYLAGTSIMKDPALLAKSKYTLESYVYVKAWQIPYIESHPSFMLDSGAFTFMSSTKGHPDWNSYIDKLCQFVSNHNVKLWFEVDIDSVLGYKRVREIRRYMENKTNRPCIPVWHICRGIDDFKAHCKDYGYVAVGSMIKSDGTWTDLTNRQHRKLVEIAQENSCQIHMLGRTSSGFLEQVRPDSADSTSWCAYSRYGNIVTFENGKLIIEKHPDKHCIQSANRLRAYEQFLKFQEYADKFI